MMIRATYICDHCNLEVRAINGLLGDPTIPSDWHTMQWTNHKISKFHYCGTCVKRVVEFLRGYSE